MKSRNFLLQVAWKSVSGTAIYMKTRINTTNHMRICVRYYKSRTLHLNHYHHSTKLYRKYHAATQSVAAQFILPPQYTNNPQNSVEESLYKCTSKLLLCIQMRESRMLWGFSVYCVCKVSWEASPCLILRVLFNITSFLGLKRRRRRKAWFQYQSKALITTVSSVCLQPG